MRPSAKPHRTPNSSIHSTACMTDGPLGLTKSISLSPCSSQELTPPITPSQVNLTPPLVPTGEFGCGSRYSSNAAVGAQPILYPEVPVEQQMVPPVGPLSAQPGYFPVPPAFLQPSMMGMPVYVTMPPGPMHPRRAAAVLLCRPL
ncbi:hypothetical protein TRSC58_03259 [Trypanosoma rangeli SC58]|uniref:Uncharacterized protein n=1 Tax=Trypanosoma rangeli SC58 TaxID=429131 RepID=A0A061J0V1_TRYRA|nr:hypothetical protein TRSC58_03259 [Trypanosoma rangeli SC58]